MIHSRIKCPEAISSKITLHIKTSNGEDYTLEHIVSRPTRFDEIVISQTIDTKSRRPRRLTEPRGEFISNKIAAAIRNQWWKAATVDNIRTPFLDTRNINPNNVAHLLLDIIPYCRYIKKITGDRSSFVFEPLSATALALLSKFDITPHQTMHRVSGSQFELFGTRGLAAYELHEVFDCFGINFFPSTYDDYYIPPNHDFEKIFISRRGPRSITNEAEVENILRSKGFKKIYMEDYTISEQLTIGASARDVVAIHGAGMAYLIMSSQARRIVEVLPPNVYHEFFPVCLSGHYIEYNQIMSEYDEAVPLKGWEEILRHKNKPFSVSVEQLESILS